MHLKIYLYICFFLAFFIVWSQLAFPMAGKVINMDASPVDNEESVSVFNSIREAANNKAQSNYVEFFTDKALLDELNSFHIVNYHIEIESTRIIPAKLIESRVIPQEKYVSRLIAKVDEQTSSAKASAFGKAIISFSILLDTTDLSGDEIDEMISTLSINITWKDFFGIGRDVRIIHPKVDL